MKKARLFAQIVYYVFTFALGVFLAFFLPYYYFEVGSLDVMRDNLESGNYSDAMILVGGYFNKQPALDVKFDGGGGLVLFESATLWSENAENDVEEGDNKKVEDTKLHFSYAGFVYGVKDSYKLTSSTGNQTRLVVIDASGKTHRVQILDHDNNSDGSLDTNATCIQKGFFFLDLYGYSQEQTDGFSSIRKLTFYDKDNVVFEEVEANLNYDGQFFADVKTFVDEYNRDFKSDKLETLDKEFRDKNDNYLISSSNVVKSNADKKAAVVVVIYFVCVYIIADFLVGGRYIIKFFRWLLVKVFKVKFKTKSVKREEVFGHDYYSQVTIVLDVSAVSDFSESVQIRYTGESGEEISFLLLKEQGYQVTERVKAGTYVNLWVDIDKNLYATQNLPETLVVEGYKKALKINIIKREE